MNILSSNATGGFIDFGDTDYGHRGRILYGHATDYMVFHTAGTEKMRITSSGNINIGTGAASDTYVRIYNASSGDITAGYQVYNGSNLDLNIYTNPLFGNSTFFSRETFSFNTSAGVKVKILNNGNVGIGTTSPQSKLDLIQPDSSANTLGQSITAALGIRMANAIGQVGQIVFNNDAAPSYGYGSIGMIMTSGTGVGLGDMIFATKSTGSDSASTERMRISSTGSIGMGANSASYKLRVKSDATVDNGIYLSAGTGSSNHSFYVENQDGSAEFFAVRGDGEIRFNATSGHTYAAQGIRFGANDSTNNLNYYKEGTWTPTIKDLNGNLATLSAASGTYTKIGRQVFLNYRVQLSSKASMANNYVLLGGLPFNHPTGTNGSGTIDYFQNMATGFSSLAWDTTSTGSVCWLVGNIGTSSTSSVYVTPAQLTDTTMLKGTIIYMAVT